MEPSSGPSGHLLPEGEGLARQLAAHFGQLWSKTVGIKLNYVTLDGKVLQPNLVAKCVHDGV